jgi:Mg2+ and Co2+ transporter CorA
MKTIVPQDWDIPVQIRDRFGDSAGRQRAMIADGHLLIVLHHPPRPNDRERKACLLWRNPAGSWTWTADGSTTHLLKRHVASFAERAEELENQLQKASFAADYFSILQAIAPLHRSSCNLHNTLQKARDMMPEDRDIIVARDAAGDTERAFELLYMEAKNGLDYTAAQRNELQSQRTYEMSVTAHRLNVLAAIFFPITAISSIFGMNFSTGLEALPGIWLFWGILSGGFLSGLILSKVISEKPTPIERTEPTAKKIRPVKHLKLRSLPSRNLNSMGRSSML